MILIAKFENDIMLNDLEFLLDAPKGDPLEFKTIEDAKQYLRSYGFGNDSIEDYFLYYDTEIESMI